MTDPHLLGIEIGGTKLQLGLGDGAGRIVSLRRLAVDPAAGSAGILRQIEASAPLVCQEAGTGLDRVRAVGVGFGGPVDTARGTVTTSHQVGGWDRFPLADWLRARLGIGTVALQNDADTAGLAEARFGAGVGLSPVLYVTVGSGIGGSLVLDGRIYRGSGLGAVEIGHLRVPGPRGDSTVEEMASGWGIADHARRRVEEALRTEADPGALIELAGGPPHAIRATDVAEAARRGDPLAREVLEWATRALAAGLAHAVTLLAPGRIILGGGVSLLEEALWFTPIRTLLDSWVFPPFRGTFDVVPAALGEAVVVHGALALARDGC